ncbi:MAG: von Willebrand factor [Gemmataceae bacterium]|nr:von Willebrand factor [Gemmataceae bacterium]
MFWTRPVGLRKRCIHLVPVFLIGWLCLVLTACDEKPKASGPDFVGSSVKPPGGGRAEPGTPQAKPLPTPQTPVPESKPADSPAKSNQEAYAPIVENDFRAAQIAPLSTFSADVNTASYSNVRRFLNNGHLPPRDAVFLAELVNYFPYRYPNPTGDAPVSMTLDLAPCPWKADHQLARIGVRAKSFEPGESPRRNLVFLIDTSGSMASEERLPLVKKSFELLVHQLRADDQVSIVTYAGDSRVRLHPTPGQQKETILGVINSLTAGGGTNGEGGIKKAYEVARASFIGNGINRVILCTDGDFNVGQTSESELAQLIERERNSQVFLTVLGYGMGNLKNQTMEQLANKGNGHYAYIDSLDEARKVFVEQGAALAVVAKDVKFQVEFNPKRVVAYRLLGYENRLLKDEDFKNDKVDAGDMGSGHTVTALYELVPVGVKIELPGVDPLKYQAPGQPAGPADEWLTVKMRYKAPTGEASKEVAAVLPAGAADKPAAEDFAFASAVAEWGLLLRESPYKGSASYPAALKRAEASAAYDPNGHRAAFLGLLRKTIELAGKEKTQ